MAPGSRLRIHLRSVGSWAGETNRWRAGNRRRARSDHQILDQRLLPCRPVKGRSEGSIRRSSSCGLRLSWPSAEPGARCESHRRRQGEQPALELGMGHAGGKHRARLPARPEPRADRVRREEPALEADGATGRRDSVPQRHRRGTGARQAIRRLAVRNPVHPSGQTLDLALTEWPEDLRVREWPV